MIYQELINSIKENEGFRGMPYEDTRGYLTIGYGTLLPITKKEAEMLLQHRLNNIVDEIISYKPYFVELPQSIQEVLAEMGYQLGVPKLMQFKKMWANIEEGNWQGMVDEMYDSRWYHQTPNRVKKLANKVIEFMNS